MTADAHACLQEAAQRLSTKPKCDKRSYPLKLKLLDCYCDLTDLMLTTEILASSELQTLFDGFCGAVMSGELVAKSLAERINICREVAMILTEAHVGVSETYPITWHPELLNLIKKSGYTYKAVSVAQKNFFGAAGPFWIEMASLVIRQLQESG